MFTQDIPAESTSRVESIRAVMSARSSERPRTRKSQLSSWLTVVSARPLTIAVRSRTQLQKRYVPTTSLRCWFSP
ncbi:hypothetical protein AHiyo8_63500 [Arthrobacter sp. Hiyo8]|nr:hypothetical protein AHiyo8_63500 [Arthrobacter sp. Hiyo8]